MFGQMSPIAPPPQSAMADLMQILNLISDPDKAKALIKSLAEQTAELNDKQQKLSIKEPELAGLQKTLEEKEQYLKAWESELELKAKEVLVKVQAAAKREKDIEVREAKQLGQFDEMQSGLDSALRTVALREKQVEEKLKEASAAMTDAEALRAEYAAKLDKLKAMVGA